LIAAIDVSAEQERLHNATFSPEMPAAPAKQASGSSTAGSELDRLLAQGDREIALQDAKAATATFESILANYPGLPKAEYGLAIASVMAGNADRAEQLFAQLVSPPPASTAASRPEDAADPTIVSWSHVYLGRIHDLEGERDAAVHEYLGALAVEGAPESARVAAQHGVDEPYKGRARASGIGNEK
jgi:predicted Zn-dependent protease